MDEHGWQFKCATSSMHNKDKKILTWNNQLEEKGKKLGFKSLPTYKSLHCVHGNPPHAVRYALVVHSPPPSVREHIAHTANSAPHT